MIATHAKRKIHFDKTRRNELRGGEKSSVFEYPGISPLIVILSKISSTKEFAGVVIVNTYLYLYSHYLK
jgi:hypothetical protein